MVDGLALVGAVRAGMAVYRASVHVARSLPAMGWRLLVTLQTAAGRLRRRGVGPVKCIYPRYLKK
jgi:hypothetical protein